MTHEEKADELFWVHWEGLYKRLTEDERDLVDEMIKRTREDTYAEAESNIRNVREIK